MNARVREEVGHRGVRSARDTWVMSNLVSTDEVIGPIAYSARPGHPLRWDLGSRSGPPGRIGAERRP